MKLCRYTPLHLALANGWKETAMSLVHSGANGSKKSKDNFTPSEYARSRGFKELANAFEKEYQHFEMIRRWQLKQEAARQAK